MPTGRQRLARPDSLDLGFPVDGKNSGINSPVEVGSEHPIVYDGFQKTAQVQPARLVVTSFTMFFRGLTV